MLNEDIKHKLQAVQARRLVALLCRRTGHGRAWFYEVLRGRASIAGDLRMLDEVLQLSPNPIANLREACGVQKATLARLLGLSRQSLHSWEREPTAERIERVRSALASHRRE